MTAASEAMVVNALKVVFSKSKSDVEFKDEQPSVEIGSVFEGGALAEAPKLIQAAIHMDPMRPITTPYNMEIRSY